jgi:hypothetical protein
LDNRDTTLARVPDREHGYRVGRTPPLVKVDQKSKFTTAVKLFGRSGFNPFASER